MIVNNIKKHSYAGFMALIHQLFQPLRSTIGILNGIGIHTIIAPVAAARKLCYRHELYGCDTKVPQIREARYHSFEGSFISKGAYMKLIYDQFLLWYTFP